MKNMMPSIEIYMLTYVLELEDGKYYVGKSTNLNLRLAQHFTGDGSRWTKRYKPMRLLHVFLGDVEREKTLFFMKTYGWQNVRGSSWCKVHMTSAPMCLRYYLLDLD